MTRARDVATQGGLVLLNTTTFSAQSTVSINNVFSAIYSNYKIIINYGGSVGTTSRIKFRVGGVDNSADYYTQSWTVSAGSGTGALEGPVTTGYLIGSHTGTNHLSSFEIGLPFLSTQPTTYFGSRAYSADMQIKSGIHNVSASFDGFTLIPASGNLTGTIQVYGYKNS
jgi:hypothetical protein